jgi:hypothetical protein
MVLLRNLLHPNRHIVPLQMTNRIINLLHPSMMFPRKELQLLPVERGRPATARIPTGLDQMSLSPVLLRGRMKLLPEISLR